MQLQTALSAPLLFLSFAVHAAPASEVVLGLLAVNQCHICSDLLRKCNNVEEFSGGADTALCLQGVCNKSRHACKGCFACKDSGYEEWKGSSIVFKGKDAEDTASTDESLRQSLDYLSRQS